MIEVLLAVFQRPDRVPKIIEQLKRQTIQNFTFNIWNNSGKLLDVSGFPKERLRIVTSTKNRGAGDRFQLIKYTKGNPIITFDDDENLKDDFIDYHNEQYKKWKGKYLLGWYSKIFDERGYKEEKDICLSYGTEVDFIGSGGMVIGRKFFDISPDLITLPDNFIKANDIYFSAVAKMNGYKLISIDKKCDIIYDGLDSNRHDKQYKLNAFQELRDKGWKLLYEQSEHSSN